MKNTLIPKSIVFGLFCFALTIGVVVHLNQMDQIVDLLVFEGNSLEMANLKLRNLIIVKVISVCLLITLFALGVRVSKRLIEKERVKFGIPIFVLFSIIYAGICSLAYQILDVSFSLSMMTDDTINYHVPIISDGFQFYFSLGIGALFASTTFSFLITNHASKNKIGIRDLSSRYWFFCYLINFLIITFLYFLFIGIESFSLGFIWVILNLFFMAFLTTIIGSFFLTSFLDGYKIQLEKLLEKSSLGLVSGFGVFSFFIILIGLALGLDSAFGSFLEFFPAYMLRISILVVISGGISIAIWEWNLGGLRKDLMLASTNSELSNLKSQINPHFLFNSLNSLYGLALEESSPKTSTGIQKLSEMMRFMLRENVEDTIEISREFEYVENYIELQKLRVDGNEKVRLEYDIDKACEGKITPMLMIPFIENAFKHGVSAHLDSWIDIKLKCEKDSIHLNVKNSNHRKTKSTEEESGIGLENVRQRLAMLYPNKHLFQIFDNDESFEINLKIELN